jgi:hypothetical protein
MVNQETPIAARLCTVRARRPARMHAAFRVEAGTIADSMHHCVPTVVGTGE